MITVKSIYRYPIKSCAGMSLNEALIDNRGIVLDRHYVVVDERGMFVSQRSGNTYGNLGIHSMCLITPEVHSDRLFMAVNAPRMPELQFNLFKPSGERVRAQIWGDTVDAIEVSHFVSEWFTMFLSREREGQYKLVEMEEGFLRPAGDSAVGFADAYPFLVVSEESLAELNRRMGGEPVGMDRFRPNIVVGGCERPHTEDFLDRMKINDVRFDGHNLCDRCPIPGRNQSTGKKDGRPLVALSKYRKMMHGSDKVQFGRNFTHCDSGRIRVGDEVIVRP